MPESKLLFTIAYYTVVQDDRTGWTGGLLLLNPAGRPIEFQCTLPVRPSRAHQILYGPTLRDHLIGEIIGPLLVQKTRTPISLLCCDQPESLRLQMHLDAPVALVAEAAEDEEGPVTDDMIAGSGDVHLAGASLRVAIERMDQLCRMLPEFADLPDAVEPFERIREAIEEAHSQIARTQMPRAA